MDAPELRGTDPGQVPRNRRRARAKSMVVGMTESLVPRVVKSVLVVEENNSVVVTWGLGEPVTSTATIANGTFP